MATYEKVNKDKLKKIVTPPIVESIIDRCNIQTKIDHLELDKARIQIGNQ